MLSFYCIFEIQHNYPVQLHFSNVVVNCFHFTVSLRYNTTNCRFSIVVHWLWIAFILLYLWDTTQPWIYAHIQLSGCELLSFYCIFEIQHNNQRIGETWIKVVNCFHFTVSLRYNTTNNLSHCTWLTLWIAFILLYLWDTTQRIDFSSIILAGCELLSFYCIFEIQHNLKI